MNADQLIQLAQTIETRASRAIRAADQKAAADDVRLTSATAAKAVAEELRSEWLRMHVQPSGRRAGKQSSAKQLKAMHDQLQEAVAGALAGVEPGAMPGLARAAIVAMAEPLRRL